MGTPAKKPNLAQYSRETVLDDEQVEAWLGASPDVLMSVGIPFVQLGRFRRWQVGVVLDYLERKAKAA